MIKLELTEEQYEILTAELRELEGFRWNSDHIHANDCPSEILWEIEFQHSNQLKENE